MNLIDVAFSAINDLELDAVRVEGFPVLNLSVKVPNGKLDMYIHAHDDTRRLLVYTRPQGILIKDQDIPKVADFITRANYGLPLGNFELDLNDGELNFKNTLAIEDGDLTEKMVNTLVTFSIECVNRYLPGIEAVLSGTSPKEAIERIDGPTKVMIT